MRVYVSVFYVSVIVLRHIVRYSIIVSFSGSLGDAVASSLAWQNHEGPEETSQPCLQENQKSRWVRSALSGGDVQQAVCRKIQT